MPPSPRGGVIPGATDPALEQRYRIFLSYGREDAGELAVRLQALLEARGHTVWRDQPEIKGGRAWEEQIEQALDERTDIVVAVLSPHAVRRPDGVCLDEISYARFHGLPIVPVMAQSCKPPLSIHRLDWVDFRQWRRAAGFREAAGRLEEALRYVTQGDVEGYRTGPPEHIRPLSFDSDLIRLTRDFTGREWLWDEIHAWLQEAAESRVFLITGDPGAGKSAMMAHLATKHPQVVALHLCTGAVEATLDPAAFTRSLASQLATQLPGYAEALRALPRDAYLQADPGVLFRSLVVDPLQAEQETTPRLVLVDALDEAETFGGGPSIGTLLARHLTDLPPWVRVVLSTRRRPDVMDRFHAFRPHEITADGPENRADIRSYLHQALHEPALSGRLARARTGLDALVGRLETQASGNFLYARQAIEGIRSGLLHPDDSRAFPRGLVGLYHSFFERLFPTLEDFRAFRPLLDVLVAAYEPPTAELVACALDRDPFDVDTELERVAALFTRQEGRYRAYHKSVTDWLAGDAGGSRTYRANLRAGHQGLARAGSAAWAREGRGMDEYFLRYLVSHLIETAAWDELCSLLTSLPYVEAKAAAGQILELQREYDAVHSRCPAARPERFILNVLSRALGHEASFLLRHPESVFQVLWNRGWWYDAPASAAWFELPEGDDGYVPPWERAGPKVHVLLERWRAEREAPRPAWARRVFPPGDCYSGSRTVLRATAGAVWSPGGELLASAEEGCPVRVWRTDLTGEPLVLGGAEYGIRKLSWTPDGRRLAGTGSDYVVRVWEVQRPGQPLVLDGPEGKVYRLAWTADGQRLAAVCADGRVWTWHLEEPGEQGCLEGPRVGDFSLAWSPDGRRIAIAPPGAGYAVLVWRHGIDPLLVLPGPPDRVAYRLAWSPDGKRLAASFSDITRVWWIDRPRAHIDLQGAESVWSPDGRFLATADNNHLIRVWRTEWDAEPVVLSGHAALVHELAWSPEGQRIASASADRTIRVWQADGRGEPLILRGHTNAVTNVVWSRDGRHLTSASPDDTIRVWRADETGEPLLPRGHAGAIRQLAWSPDGSRLASASEDHSVGVWWGDGAREPLVLRGHAGPVTEVSWASDGKHLASRANDHTVRVWAADGRKEPLVLSQGNWLFHPVWSPDGRRLAMGCTDGAVLAGKPGPGSVRWNTLYAVKVLHADGAGDPLVLRGNGEAVNVAAWSPDGRRLAGACRRLVWIWRTDRPAEPLALSGHDQGIYELAWSPGGQRLASASRDGTVRLWRPGEGGEPVVLGGHAGDVVGVAWSPDGQRLASACPGDQAVRIWDADGAGELLVLPTGTHHFWRITWSPDGRSLVLKADDYTCQVWDTATGTLLASGGLSLFDRFSRGPELLPAFICRPSSRDTCVERAESGQTVAWFEEQLGAREPHGGGAPLLLHPRGEPMWAARQGSGVVLFRVEEGTERTA